MSERREPNQISEQQINEIVKRANKAADNMDRVSTGMKLDAYIASLTPRKLTGSRILIENLATVCYVNDPQDWRRASLLKGLTVGLEFRNQLLGKKDRKQADVESLEPRVATLLILRKEDPLFTAEDLVWRAGSGDCSKVAWNSLPDRLKQFKLKNPGAAYGQEVHQNYQNGFKYIAGDGVSRLWANAAATPKSPDTEAVVDINNMLLVLELMPTRYVGKLFEPESIDPSDLEES